MKISFYFFSNTVTSPPTQPVFVFVLSTRTALIVLKLLNFSKTSATCSARTVPVASVSGNQIYTLIWCLLCDCQVAFRSFGFFRILLPFSSTDSL